MRTIKDWLFQALAGSFHRYRGPPPSRREAWSESNLFTLTIAIMAVYSVSMLGGCETATAIVRIFRSPARRRRISGSLASNSCSEGAGSLVPQGTNFTEKALAEARAFSMSMEDGKTMFK